MVRPVSELLARMERLLGDFAKRAPQKIFLGSLLVSAFLALLSLYFTLVFLLAFQNSSALPRPREIAPDSAAPSLFVEKFFHLTDQDHKPRPPATCAFSSACLHVREDAPEMVLDVLQTDPGVLAACEASTVPIRALHENDSTLHQRWYDHDLLLGFFPPDYAYQFPHFVMLAGMLFDLAEILFGNRALFGSPQFRYQRSLLSDDLTWRISNTIEPSMQLRRQTLRPAILVHDAVLTPRGDPKLVWIHRFVSHLFQASASKPVMIAPPPTSELACFRSVWLPAARINSRHRLPLASHTLYMDNGWTKTAPTDFCASPQITVTIVNRKDSRSLTNVGKIKTVVKRALQLWYSDIQIEEIFFEGMTFEEQAAVMQRSGVVVGAHGAGLTNSVFLRMDTFLLEVVPFGYTYAGFQKGLDKLFDIQGAFVMSEPDIDGFKAGLFKECTEDCDQHLTHYRDLVAKANMTFVQESIQSVRKYPENGALEANPDAAAGLRAQALTGDPRLIEKRLRSWVLSRCPTKTRIRKTLKSS